MVDEEYFGVDFKKEYTSKKPIKVIDDGIRYGEIIPEIVNEIDDKCFLAIMNITTLLR